MIILGMQGLVKLTDQAKIPHIYMDEMDAAMAKPLLMTLYESCPSANHISFSMFVCGWYLKSTWYLTPRKDERMLISCGTPGY